jgi:hypothetical protein
VTVYTDITAMKRQEELLRARSEELSDQLLSHAEELAAPTASWRPPSRSWRRPSAN